MAKPGVLKQLNWASATPPVVELVFASFLANDLPEAIMANQKTVKLGEIHALLEQDDRFGEHGVKPPSLSTLGTWLSNGERAWKAYPKARVSRYARSTTRAPCVRAADVRARRCALACSRPGILARGHTSPRPA